ncbi:MAG: hypothetical protein JSV92_03295 [archaeon]|nr:MAG: hypothetical protein JSV92_03295 [archaeon]
MTHMELYILALVCLIAPVFAEYAKIRKKAEKAFNWIAVAGVSFVLATAFSIAFWTEMGIANIAMYGAWLFQFIGWIFVLFGAILAIVTLMKK